MKPIRLDVGQIIKTTIPKKGLEVEKTEENLSRATVSHFKRREVAIKRIATLATNAQNVTQPHTGVNGAQSNGLKEK